MAISKVTIDALTQMSERLRLSSESILSTKSDMDLQLNSFIWDDPVAIVFKNDYQERLKPITDKLIPNIEQYLKHISELGVQVGEYDKDVIMMAGLVGGVIGTSTLNVTTKISHGTISGITPKLKSPFRDDKFEKSLDGISEADLKIKADQYRDYLEKAQLAKYAYHEDEALPDGWVDLSRGDSKIKQICDDISLNGGDESGLKFSVLQKGDKYIISFGGTDFDKGFIEAYRDGKTDIMGAFSANEQQSELSKQLVSRLVKEGNIPLNQIEFTGHSLGGRLAAENSVEFLRPATTFNAAGSHPNMYGKYGRFTGSVPGYCGSSNYLGIRNVVTEHDFLTNLQSTASGSKNPYIAAIPKDGIKIVHDTLSGTLSDPKGKVAMGILSSVAPPVSKGLSLTDKSLGVMDKFNDYYNRDYRALGATLTLPDGLGGLDPTSRLEAHKIGTVEDLLRKRLEMIEKRF